VLLVLVQPLGRRSSASPTCEIPSTGLADISPASFAHSQKADRLDSFRFTVAGFWLLTVSR
jgi:hypothetical protein